MKEEGGDDASDVSGQCAETPAVQVLTGALGVHYASMPVEGN